MPVITYDTKLTAKRRERFNGVKAGYEAEGPDGSVPGASSSPAQYAVVTESTRGHGYFVNYATTLDEVEIVAGANIHEGWQPVCYYDLDVLAGPEPDPCEGDRVKFGDRELYVVHVSDDVEHGEIFHWLYLHEEIEPEGWIDACEKVDEYQCEIIERVNPDERNPVRYLMAGVRTIVVFNTEAAKP